MSDHEGIISSYAVDAQVNRSTVGRKRAVIVEKCFVIDYFKLDGRRDDDALRPLTRLNIFDKMLDHEVHSIDQHERT
jgi:hypothetical protein